MNKRAREFIVKLFSLIIAITMSIPTNVFASSGTKRPKEMPTIIRIADSGGGEDTYIEDTSQDTYIEDSGEAYSEEIIESAPAETTEVIEEAPQEEASTIAEEDASNYILSQKARLNDNHDGIIYDIKLAKKEKSYHDPNNRLSLSLMLNPNQALKDIKLTKVVIDGKEEQREDKSNKQDELHTLNLSTPTFENEITYTVEAPIDKRAIDTNKLYSMDLSLDIGQFNLILQRISYKFVEYEKEDKTKELKLTHIKEAEDALRSISYKKDDGDVDKVIYTDYIISKDKGDEESRVNEKNKINYAINLENLKKEDTEISLDYYKADDKGFNMKKEFSTKVPYQEKLDLDIPASYILKLTVTSKADKNNTKIESHKINGREVKSPRFVKEEEKSSDDDEEAAKKAEEEKKAAEEKAKAEEEKKAAEEKAKAEEERKAEEAKKAEEARKAEEAKKVEEKAEEEKASSEKEAKESKEETNDKLKAEKEADKKEANKKDDLLNSLKEEAPTKEEENKAKTEIKKDSDLSKADAELKAALSDETKGIEDIQNLLTSLGEKYKLTREDQAKLMTANDAAIKAIVEKDREENDRPNNLRQEEPNSWDNKLFHLNLKMEVKASTTNPIPAGWYFDVKVGPYLKEHPGKQIKDLTDESGRFVAYATYYDDGRYIRYNFIRDITKDTTLTVDQDLAFDTTVIGDKESVDINIKVAPKNNPVQSMDTITVKKDDPSPVESTYKVEEQGPTTEITYPYQLSYETKPTIVRDSKDKKVEAGSDLNGAYVEWNIVVDTSSINNKSNLDFKKINLTVFGSNNQGLKNFKFKASTNETDLDKDGGYRSSASSNELLFQNSLIDKKDLGDKLYIRVKGYIDSNHPHPEYSIGFRINPDNNYVTNMLKDFQDKFDKLPTPIKWLEGVEDAKRFADIPFNLVETMIPARVNLKDNFTNEGFYYDHTRTIVATRESDTRVDWHALDLLRIDETEDPALSNPDFLLNGSNDKNPKKINKVYYVPLQTGSYRRTNNLNDVLRDDGKFYPGTIVAYEYVNQEGSADDVYNMIASIKEKKVDNLDPSYNAPTEGGIANLFIEKVSNSSLKDNYIAYIEHPYNVMRINKNFDMVQCFNSGIQDPTYKGSNGVFLDIHEDVSGDYLISRLNESIGKPSYNHSLVKILNGTPYDGVNFNPNGKPQGEAMEDLMKRVYFYGEEVKKQYANNDYGENTQKEEMHRMIETSMYQRVVHHLTDGKDLGEDYFTAPSDYNVTEWKVPYTLTGRRETAPKIGYEGQYTGDGSQEDRYLKDPDKLRKLKDNEKQISNWPPVQETEYRMAAKLWEKVKASYGTNSDWNKAKADSVQLVFYSHTESKKYQELITGRVTEPIQIDKYKANEKDKLEGAEFTFYNIYTGEETKWKSSKDNKDHKLYLKPGTYRVRETTPPTGYQKLKDFTIEVSRQAINADKGPYKFVKLPEIHVNDGYKTKITLDNVPVSATGKEMVEIDENNDIKVKVINIEDNLGKIKFTKKNKYTKLNGAEFTLRKIKADSLEDARAQVDNPTYDEKAYKQVSSGQYGVFEFDQISKGYYVLEETKVPSGYKKADNKLLIAEPGKDKNGKDTIIVKFDDESVYQNDEAVIVNESKDTEIEFRKVREEYLGKNDKEHLGLANAKFRLESIWTVDGSTYLKEVFSDSPKATPEGTKKIDGDQSQGGGYFKFTNLPIGEYILRELQQPNGFEKTNLYGWKLVVKEDEDENLVYELYELPKYEDLNKTNLKKVEPEDIVVGDGNKSVYQIGNKPRTKDFKFDKDLGRLKRDKNGDLIKDEDGNPILDTTPYSKKELDGKDGKPVSFDLYKADFYGAIIKDKNGQPIKVNKEPITQDDDGNFTLKGLEFGGYYVLRETNPPKGHTNANDILLKVEAEAIASEGEMKLIVRDPNNNSKIGAHAVFEGVIDFKEGEKFGKFSIKKTGNAIGFVDPDDKEPIKVGLRRAYFRLYTADENYVVAKNEAGFPKEYIQKVTPGVPIIRYKTDKDGKYILDGNGKKIREGVDPKELPPNQGIVTFDNLRPGYYVLEEYRGPAGYEKSTEKWNIRVDDNGNVTKFKASSTSTESTNSTNALFESVRYKENGLSLENANMPLRQNANDQDFNEFTKIYQDLDDKLDITVKAKPVDKTTGEREINLSISPKEVQGKVPTNVQLVFMIDRSRDYSIDNKFAEGRTLDKNINKIITDIAKKAKENNTNIDVTFIEYNNQDNAIKGTPNQSLTKLYDDITTTETYKLKYANTGEVVDTQYKDFINKVGIKARNTNRDDSSESLYKNIDTYLGKIKNSKEYDKKILVDFTNFLSTKAKKNKTTNNFYKKDIINKFTDFDAYVRHIDQKSTLSSPYSEMYKDNTMDFKLHGDNDGQNIQAQFVEKDLLNKLLKDEYYFKEGTNPEVKANLNLILNEAIKLIGKNANIGSTSLSPVVDESTGKTSIELDNINLKAGEKLNLTYKIGIKNPKLDQTYTINDSITLTVGDKITNIPTTGLVTVKEGNTTPDPEPEPKPTNNKIRVKLEYLSDSKTPLEIDPVGELILQKSDGTTGWTKVESKGAPKEGKVEFKNLDSNKKYRLVYERNEKLAKDWGYEQTSYYDIDFLKAKKEGEYKVNIINIENGNMLEIFNIDETGFRIPLRITKVNENRGLLTGSQFRARKIINGDSKEDKYYDEKFDAVSEATGLPGDNYFRELTPGIYELWETQTPDGSYRLPTDEKGNPVKWYFKVMVREGKVPSDDDYMKIEFNFEHEFKETDDWNKDYPDDEKAKLIGKKIHGIDKGYKDEKGNEVYDLYTEVVPDDGRSDPARPDAPYKGIDDVWVTNYMTTTELKFMKKDSETQKNLENAVFTLKKALVGKDGNVEFDANGKAKVDPQTGVKEEEKAKPEPYNKEKGYAEATASKVSGVSFTNIQEGTYILEEIKPADGYKLNDDSFITIKFTPGKDGSWTQEIKGYKKDTNGKYKEIPEADTSLFIKSDKGDLESVENTQLKINLNFTKMNASTNTKLNGTGFKVFEVDKNGKKIPDGYEREIAGFGSAVYNFRNLTVGRYRLEETITIEGFAKPEPWYFNVVQDPDSLKLKIEFENKDNSIEYSTDTQGNLQDVQVNNYLKIPFRFKKVTGENKPLKDAYFVLKKVRESLNDKSMSFDYYENGNLKTLVKDGKTYSYDKNGQLDKIDDTKVTGEDRYDSVSGATKRYYKANVRSQEDGEVNFRDLDEGIYELIETDIPDGYEDATQQIRWIIEVRKGENGLEVIYNKKTEDSYYSKYETEYYNTYTANGFKDKNNFEKLDKDPDDFQYKLINKKNTIDLKWKKYRGNTTEHLIEKYTRFDLIKVIPNPEPDEYGKVADPMDEKNALTGQSYGGTRNIAASTNGIFEVKDLSKGIYVLYETKAPDGYKLMDRQIVIKVYEDPDDGYKLKKKFYEIEEDSEGNKSLVENEKLSYIFASNKKPFIDQDGYFYVNNREKPYLVLSKGFMTEVNGVNKFNHINSGELELSLYKDPKDTKNTDTNVYSQTINLGKDQYYKFPLGDIQTDVAYLLEETKAPAGYAKSKNKYRIEFRKVDNTTIAPYLVGIVKPDGTDLKDKEGNLITDTGEKIDTGGTKIELKGTLANASSSFKIVNNKTEVEFTKVGKDTVKDGDKLVDKETPLEGVKFYLEKQDQDRNYYPVTSNLEFIKKDDKGYYIEKANGEKDYGNALNPVSIDKNAYTFTSKSKGKFKITGLTDGFYQLIEPNAPKDEKGEEYMKVQGAVKKFRILEGEVYIEDDKTEKKLSEASDKDKTRLTKITNVKPGKGEFELNKTNEDGESLDDVTFELYDSEGKVIRTENTKNGGKINFTGLPFGSYWIKETKTKDGYVVDRKIRRVLLGKDWNVPENPTNPKDVTKDILFESTNEPELKSIGGQKESTSTVYPNQQEAMLAYFKFNVKEGVEVKPGDTFTLDFSDNVDLYGIFVDNNGDRKIEDDNDFNIISDAGLVAKAKVNEDKHSITYTFTEYIDNYKLGTMKLSAQLYVNRYKVPNSQEITVTAKAGNTYSDSIKVDYRGYTQGQSHTGYQDPRVDVSSYMLRLNPDTNTFTTIVYVNQWNKATFNKYLTFTTDKNVEITSMKKYIKLGNGSHNDEYQAGDLPDSYGVDLSDTSKYKYDGNTYQKLNDRSYRMFIGATNPNTQYYANAYVVEIKGKITEKDAKSLRTNSYLYANTIGDRWYASYNNPFREYNNTYTYGYWTNKYWEIGNFETWSQFYNPEASSDGTLSYNFINYKNRIEYIKINSGIRGEAVDKKKEAQNAEGDQVIGKPVGSSNTVGSPLEGAKFELRKKSTIGAATRVEGSERTSDKNGKFFWEKLSPGNYEVWEIEAPKGFKTPDKAVSTFTVDNNGNIVDIKNGKLTIENYKNAQIKIRKTDLNGNTLDGASFLLTQETGSIEYGAKFGKKDETNNTIVFDDLPVGTYKLEEKRAPSGFIKSNKIWNIEVRKDGTVKWLNSFDDSKDTMNTIKAQSYVGENGTNITSEVIGINTKDKIFRQKFTIKAKASDIKDKAITIESLANDIKLTDANTKIRLVASDDGKIISDKDNTSYKVEYNNENPNLKVTIKPDSTNKDKEKTYIIIVDMPYKEATKVGANINYNKQTVSRYLQSFTAEEKTLDMKNYKGKYLDRDINKVELLISNKKGEYPYTGGPGIWIGFTILGVLTMTAAGIYLAQKKKYHTK